MSLVGTDCCRLVFPFAETIMPELLSGKNKPVLFCILSASLTNVLTQQPFYSQSLPIENTSNNSLYLSNGQEMMSKAFDFLFQNIPSFSEKADFLDLGEEGRLCRRP